MTSKISKALDSVSEFLAHRKGLLPIVGILLITINAIIQFYPGEGWLVETNLLLHLGIVLAVIGLLLAWAL